MLSPLVPLEPSPLVLFGLFSPLAIDVRKGEANQNVSVHRRDSVKGKERRIRSFRILGCINVRLTCGDVFPPVVLPDPSFPVFASFDEFELDPEDDGEVDPEDDDGLDPEDDDGLDPEDDDGLDPEDDGGLDPEDDVGLEPEDDEGFALGCDFKRDELRQSKVKIVK